MSDTHHFTAQTVWNRAQPDFAYETYDRGHTITLGSGTALQASAAPAYRGDPQKVNPEEQLVAALSSCHMLTFLAIAARKRFVVDSYEDEASGTLEQNPQGKLAVTRVTLRPRVVFSGPRQPSAEERAAMHHTAHRECFIANSVRTEVTVAER
jgi:organic hydroperoxide reductase OsmC/OhrA